MTNNPVLAAVFGALVVASCSGGGGSSAPAIAPPPTNTVPAPSAVVADAGDPQILDISSTGYQLDGSGSSSGSDIVLDWDLVEVPQSFSETVILQPSQAVANPSFNATVPGVYAFSLSVRNAMGLEDVDTTYVALRNDPSSPQYSTTQVVQSFGTPYEIDVSSLLAENGLAGQFELDWEVVEAPAASSIQRTFTGEVVTLNFDVLGEYVTELRLTGNGQTFIGGIDSSFVSDLRTIGPVLGEIGRSGHSSMLNKVVVLDGSVIRLIDYQGNARTINLANTGVSLAVAPDGMTAVAGDATGLVTYIDLQTETIITTWQLPVEATSMVLDGFGYAHATGSFLTNSTFQGRVVSLDLTTGNVVANSGDAPLNFQSSIVLHPSDNRIYGFASGQIHRFDFDGMRNLSSTASYSGVSGAFNFGPGGDTIVSSRGEVYQSTDDPATDLVQIDTFTEFDAFKNTLGLSLNDLRIDGPDVGTEYWALNTVGLNDESLIHSFNVETGAITSSTLIPSVSAQLDNVIEDVRTPWNARRVFFDEESGIPIILASMPETDTGSVVTNNPDSIVLFSLGQL